MSRLLRVCCRCSEPCVRPAVQAAPGWRAWSYLQPVRQLTGLLSPVVPACCAEIESKVAEELLSLMEKAASAPPPAKSAAAAAAGADAPAAVAPAAGEGGAAAVATAGMGMGGGGGMPGMVGAGLMGMPDSYMMVGVGTPRSTASSRCWHASAPALPLLPPAQTAGAPVTLHVCASVYSSQRPRCCVGPLHPASRECKACRECRA